MLLVDGNYFSDGGEKEKKMVYTDDYDDNDDDDENPIMTMRGLTTVVTLKGKNMSGGDNGRSISGYCDTFFLLM